MKRRLVLASSSPFRRELLARLMLPFEALDPGIDETPGPGEPPQELVCRLATEKARAVGSRRHSALVIGSDQVAVDDGDIVGKPRDHADAVRQLRRASGTTVTLYTGLTLLDTDSGRIQSDVVPYQVTFRRLSDDVIERYLVKERPYGCSGSLRADGLGIALLQRFHGDDPNALIGLPLIRLVAMLEAEGVTVV